MDGPVRREADEAGRVRLAARAGTPPGQLRALAQDEAVTVRATVALNPSYAPAADRCLLSDPDERVRALLAGRLARLLPSLDPAVEQEAQEHVRAMLLKLADDAATRVRAAIAEAVKGMPEAPRNVILRLAADPIPVVSDPVLRLSPLLGDDDLLELLATPPHAGAAFAVAGRPGLSGIVADHIARFAETGAVRVLLENRSACIQESTLDALVGRAADHPEWHEPLARRPGLSLRALQSLSRTVAAQVLELIAARPDLPQAVVATLKDRLASALDPPPDAGCDVRRLLESGGATEAALLAALTAGDHGRAYAVLAAASGTDIATVERAVALRSGKALISLAWKAGFSMHAATQVQVALGRLETADVLQPQAHSGYPLGADEMEWQFELLGSPGQ